MPHLTKHLSYANVVATLCLVLIMGAGVAHAAGLAKNSVRSGHIKNGQVKTVDLAPNAVNGSKVKTNTLTGSDIAEGTLAGVDARTVGGMRMKKINFQVPYGTAKQKVLEFPGKLTVYGECQDFGDGLDVNLHTGEADAHVLGVAGFANAFNDADALQQVATSNVQHFDVAEVFLVDNVFGVFDVAEWVSIDFSTPSGFVAHLDLYLEPNAGVPPDDSGCTLTGTAIGG